MGLKASEQGLKQIHQARKARGWRWDAASLFKWEERVTAEDRKEVEILLNRL